MTADKLHRHVNVGEDDDLAFVTDSGGATPERARPNDLPGRSTALAPALAIALLCFGTSVNRK